MMNFQLLKPITRATYIRRALFWGVMILYLSKMTQAQLPQGKIAFMSEQDGNWEIYVMNADGTQPRNLTNHPAEDVNADWSPDGNKLLFISNRGGRRWRHIHVMDADGRNVKPLIEGADHRDQHAGARWSPDGTKILFVSYSLFDFLQDIHVIDTDGGNRRNLTNRPSVYLNPSWSPDGTKIVVSSDGPAPCGINCPDVYILDTQGKKLVRLTNSPTIDGAASWSPDGTKIVFHSARGGKREVYVIDANGKNLLNLTNHPASDYWPVWSPDGTKIAFSSSRDTVGDLREEVYVMEADGANPIRLTNHHLGETVPTSWSRGSFLVSPKVLLTTQWGQIKRKR